MCTALEHTGNSATGLTSSRDCALFAADMPCAVTCQRNVILDYSICEEKLERGAEFYVI